MLVMYLARGIQQYYDSLADEFDYSQENETSCGKNLKFQIELEIIILKN